MKELEKSLFADSKSSIYPTLILASGIMQSVRMVSLSWCLCKSIDRPKETGPTLPRYIVNESASFGQNVSLEVTSAESPTVAKALVDSNKASIPLMGSQNVMTQVVKITVRRATLQIARER